MALAIDGHSANYNSTTLTTTQPNDVIIVIGSESTTLPGAISDKAGLVWHQRGSSIVESQGNYLSVFWAIAPEPLTSDVISIASTHVVLAFGVSGADTSAPFDTNPSLPATTSTTGASVSVSTNAANTMVFIATGDPGGEGGVAKVVEIGGSASGSNMMREITRRDQ